MRTYPIDYDSLLRFAKTLEGQTLRTNAGRAKFMVRVEDETLCYTPLSTGEERRGSRKSVEKVLRYYNDTGSMRLQDYESMTVNRTYLLRLITLMTEGETK